MGTGRPLPVPVQVEQCCQLTGGPVGTPSFPLSLTSGNCAHSSCAELQHAPTSSPTSTLGTEEVWDTWDGPGQE